MDEESFDFSAEGPPLGPVETLDRLIMMLPPGEALRRELIELRVSVAENEEMVSEARGAIEKLEAIVKKVTSPANRIGTFLGAPTHETAQIVVGGSDYYCNLDPRRGSSLTPPRHARAGQ